VPDVSRFCNRCGSQIVVPGNLAESIPPKAAAPSPTVAEQSARTIQPIEKGIPAIEPFIIPSLASVPSNSPGAAPQQPETPREQTSIVIPMESIPSWSDSNLPATDEIPEPSRPVIIDSPNSEPMPPSGKPPVPQKPWEGLSFKPGKKVVLGIIVVIIIVAIVLGAFFLYPMISNAEAVIPDNGAALNTVPTITKNPGTAVIPSKTLKPTTTATYRPTPGNSGSTVGL
jgi:hypothetical protein